MANDDINLCLEGSPILLWFWFFNPLAPKISLVFTHFQPTFFMYILYIMNCNDLTLLVADQYRILQG